MLIAIIIKIEMRYDRNRAANNLAAYLCGFKIKEILYNTATQAHTYVPSHSK